MSSCRTRPGRGSWKTIVTFSRWIVWNCTDTSRSTASIEYRPDTIIATESATVSPEKKALPRCRSRFLTIMREAGVSRVRIPSRSSKPGRKVAGGSERIASAGAKLTARRTAATAPRQAEPAAIATAIRIRAASVSVAELGNGNIERRCSSCPKQAKARRRYPQACLPRSRPMPVPDNEGLFRNSCIRTP